jgi:hypothetical protein
MICGSIVNISWGDAPTWVAAIAAIIGGVFFAYKTNQIATRQVEAQKHANYTSVRADFRENYDNLCKAFSAVIANKELDKHYSLILGASRDAKVLLTKEIIDFVKIKPLI